MHLGHCGLTWPDVLDVLLREYKTTLLKRGFRRKEIEYYYARAQSRLDAERESETGKCP